MKRNEYPDSFVGVGEVKGFNFNLVKRDDKAAIYRVTSPSGNVYYEVFKRKFSPVCIDFQNRIYSETEENESYPKSTHFGLSAWTYPNIEGAEQRFNEINKNKIKDETISVSTENPIG